MVVPTTYFRVGRLAVQVIDTLGGLETANSNYTTSHRCFWAKSHRYKENR